MPSDGEVCDDEQQQTTFESRDPDRLLFVVEEICAVLIKRLCDAQMDSEREVVPSQKQDLNGHSELSEMETSAPDYSESVQIENKVNGNVEITEVTSDKEIEICDSATSASNGNMKEVEIIETDLDSPDDSGDIDDAKKNATITEDSVVSEADAVTDKQLHDRIAYLEEEVGKWT